MLGNIFRVFTYKLEPKFTWLFFSSHEDPPRFLILMEQPPSPGPIVTRRTRPGNADKRPGLILYETGTVQR
jgi:hypothetical protein